MFTDWYGEQSCTAGRSAFITGQSPIRTGLTKVGLPGADIGLHAEDMTVAEALKPLGYATGQLARTILATATSSYRRCTASTSSSAISTILTQRKNRKTSITQTTRASVRSSGRAGFLKLGRVIGTTQPLIRPTGALANRSSKTPGRSTPNAWRQWTRNFSMPRWILSTARLKRTLLGSATSVRYWG